MGNVTVVRFVGGLLLVLGLVLVLPGVVPAAAAPSPAVSVTPSTIAPNGRAVTVSGSGLPAGGTGAISECSSAAPQPTVLVRGVPTPVSCSRPRRVRFGSEGTLRAVRVRAVGGKVGPPGPGTDSSGTAAAADARSYPCPPTAAQAAAGAGCYLRLSWGTGAGEQTVRPLTFARQRARPGAQATVPPPVHASAQANNQTNASTGASPAGVVLNVRPHTELTDGQTVVVRASGLTPNGTARIMECSSVTPQSSITVAGLAVPVSCSDPRAGTWSINTAGRLRATFTIATGTVGPPRSGTTSTGRSSDTLARRYPCPPTAAQTNAGYHCFLELQWGSGHRAVQALSFAASVTPATVPPATANPATAATTPTASTSGSSAAQGGTLPFTGASIEQLGIVGVALVALGAVLLIGEPPRRSRRRPDYAALPAGDP
jgi:hypothetical protein